MYYIITRGAGGGVGVGVGWGALDLSYVRERASKKSDYSFQNVFSGDTSVHKRA